MARVGTSESESEMKEPGLNRYPILSRPDYIHPIVIEMDVKVFKAFCIWLAYIKSWIEICPTRKGAERKRPQQNG